MELPDWASCQSEAFPYFSPTLLLSLPPSPPAVIPPESPLSSEDNLFHIFLISDFFPSSILLLCIFTITSALPDKSSVPSCQHLRKNIVADCEQKPGKILSFKHKFSPVEFSRSREYNKKRIKKISLGGLTK